MYIFNDHWSFKYLIWLKKLCSNFTVIDKKDMYDFDKQDFTAPVVWNPHRIVQEVNYRSSGTTNNNQVPGPISSLVKAPKPVNPPILTIAKALKMLKSNTQRNTVSASAHPSRQQFIQLSTTATPDNGLRKTNQPSVRGLVKPNRNRKNIVTTSASGKLFSSFIHIVARSFQRMHSRESV